MIALSQKCYQHTNTSMHHLVVAVLSIFLVGCGPKPIKERAEAGDADAQFQLGCMLIEGRGIPKDTDMGIAWLKKAEKQGVRSATIIIQETTASPREKLQLEATAALNDSKSQASRVVLSAWCSGVIRYKQAYGFYPCLSNGQHPTTDKAYLLTGETGANFVKALSGASPDGSKLTSGANGERARLNRNCETFIDFTAADFAPNSRNAQSANLCSRKGRNIYVAIDYNGDGRISDITGIRLPTALKSAGTNTSYTARVIVFEEAPGNEEEPAVIAAQ